MKSQKLADIGENFSTGPFGSAVSSKNFVAFGVPMIRGSNLSVDVGTRLVEDDLVFVPNELVESFPRALARPGDLIFTCWGTVGQIGYLDGTTRFAEYLVSNKQMKMTPNADVVDGRYLYYYLSQPHMIRTVTDSSIGSSVPGFNLGQLRSLDVAVPNLGTQRGIAEVLGALDDKIAANEAIINVADGLVRARYEQLCAVVDRRLPLGDLAKNVRDGAATPSALAKTTYLGLEHLPRRLMWGSARGWSTEVESGKSHFSGGDVLFGRLRPYFHKVIAAPGEGICSTDILVIRSTAGLGGLVLAAATSDAAIEIADAGSGGTRMPRASWKDLATLEVPWPGDLQTRAFSRNVETVSARCLATTDESRKVAALRDALLPELMSGRLRVKDAEKTVEEVV